MSSSLGCSPAGQVRILFGLASVLIILSVILVLTVSPWWSMIALFVGVNQLAYALAGACPSSLMLRRICRGREATA